MISTASSVYTPAWTPSVAGCRHWRCAPCWPGSSLSPTARSWAARTGSPTWKVASRSFSTLPASLNWQLATWLELVGAVMLLLGLATRSVAYVFWVLTVVAIAAVHWPDQWNGLSELWQGYAITDQGYGNFKLPLLFLAMLLPLILNGGGALSVDRLLAGPQHAPVGNDGLGWGVSLIALLLPVAALLPGVGFGGALLGGVLLLGYALRRRRTA